ncbi:MAG: hypothetical protein ABI158_03475 [Edaphobacter sp.]
MNTHAIRIRLHTAVLCGAAMLLTTGCNKKANNTTNFTNAIDTYYSAHPACLWSDPVKFPVQVDTSDTSQTTGYDALVDQGLLARTTAEKKKLIIASKQVTNYDLSDKGRSLWTVDVLQPGFGNFCYGHRKVSTIDSSTPTTGDVGATTQVSYHYTLAGAPDWATAAETQTAYPQIRADVSGPQAAHATLTNTSSGWQVTGAGSTSAPATPADGRIVQ